MKEKMVPRLFRNLHGGKLALSGGAGEMAPHSHLDQRAQGSVVSDNG